VVVAYTTESSQLDRRVLESCGDLGVPKVEKKPLTNPR
jgi:hypothetical protein